MSNLARVREASLKIAKVQRRIWLVQTVFWPVVVGGAAVVFVVAARGVRRRGATPHQVAPAVSPAPAGLNGASSGN